MLTIPCEMQLKKFPTILGNIKEEEWLGERNTRVPAITRQAAKRYHCWQYYLYPPNSTRWFPLYMPANYEMSDKLF